MNDLRVQVYLPKGALGHDRLRTIALVLLVIADEMLDGGSNALRLKAINICGSQRACTHALSIAMQSAI